MKKLLIPLTFLISINSANIEDKIYKKISHYENIQLSSDQKDNGKCNYLRIKNYRQQDKQYSVNLQIPKLQNIGFVQLEKEINERIQNKLLDATKDIVKSAKEDLKYSDNEGNKYELVSTVDRKICNEKILSYLITTYEYVGGAHGNTTVDPININLVNKTELKLKDLFKAGVDYKDIINTKIKGDIEKDKDEFYENESMQFKGIRDQQEFYITDNEIVVYFQTYAIAPYVKGNPEFIFPFNEYEKYLNIDLIK